MGISTDSCTCCSGLWNIPTLVDQVLDRRLVQMHVKIDALSEQRWPPEQHSKKKSDHMLHLLCHQGPLGTVCLQQDSNLVCPVRLPPTPRHRQARILWCRVRVDWRMEWRSVVFSGESRFCHYASDGRTRIRRRPDERHLPEYIRPRHTGPTSGFMVWGPSVSTDVSVG